MSKNHPHDNIYSILGKLDALKPTPEEKRFALVKEIRESVEAKGSILSGVDAVQDKLAKQFAESKIEEKAVSKAQQKFMGMVHSAQKGGKAASPEVAKVAKSMGKKDAKDFASTKHKGLPAHVEEEQEVCSECGMAEGTCSHSMAEGEITKTEKGMRHRGTYGTEYQGDHDSEDEEQYKADKGIRKRGRPAKGTPKKVAPATGEKKGRGRPAKSAAPTYSAANDPFGRVPSKAPASKIKGTKHSLAESMQRVIEGVNFKRMAEDYNMTLDEMMDCMERDIAEYKMTGQMTEALRDFMEIHNHSKKQMADEAVNVDVPAAIRKQKGGDWKATPADVLDPKPDTLSHSANIKKRADALGFNDENPLAMPKSSIEEELDELAKLAGLTTETVDKEKFAALAEPKDKITYADKIAGAKKNEVDEGIGKTIAHGIGKVVKKVAPKWVEKQQKAIDAEIAADRKATIAGVTRLGQKVSSKKTDSDKVGEEVTDEGNAFGKAIRDAKADGVEPGEKVKVGGKEYTVKEARELVQILKIAGMETKQLEEAINAAVDEFAPVVAESRMGEIDALYQEWVNSEDAPFDSDSGDMNAVMTKAMRFLNGRVRPEQIEDIADLLANHWHGGQGVMAEEPELANSPDEEYMSMKASTLNPGEGDFGEKNMYGGPGDNPMTQRPSRPALPVRNESVIKLEAKLAAEYNSIKKTTK